MQKPIYKSKGMWSGALLIVHAVILAVMAGGPTPDAINAFLTGLGVIGIRDAIKA